MGACLGKKKDVVVNKKPKEIKLKREKYSSSQIIKKKDNIDKSIISNISKDITVIENIENDDKNYIPNIDSFGELIDWINVKCD